jgi:hypothetical protein
MHTKDAIKFALTASNGAVLSVIDEMSGAPTTFPTPNGGCHPLWVLGHLALIEGSIPAILFGGQNPAAKWAEYFGEGSEPVDDAAGYPLFAEVRDLYVRLREKNLALLESLSEADLDKPSDVLFGCARFVQVNDGCYLMHQVFRQAARYKVRMALQKGEIYGAQHG